MLRKGTQVYKPIFIIGVPRSGTTIIFEAFSVHEDLAWFSNMLGRFPDIPEISILNRLSFTNVLRGNKRQNKAHSSLRNIFPYPTECYPAWKSYCGDKFLYNYLIDQVAGENVKKRTARNILKVIRYHGKRRFAAKITGPSRINYISSIFPDAKFIHIVRDARAVVNSLMNVDFWTESDKLNKPWWENGLTAEDMEPFEMYDRSPIALAAIQWKKIITLTRKEASKISSERYCEIKYEKFMHNPYKLMQEMFEFSELKQSKKVYRYINQRSQFISRNNKYLNSLTSEGINIINKIVYDQNEAMK